MRIKQNLVSASLERQQSLYINLQCICCSTQLYIQDLHLADTTISPVTGRKESGSVAGTLASINGYNAEKNIKTDVS